jgi:hypothetical protein
VKLSEYTYSRDAYGRVVSLSSLEGTPATVNTLVDNLAFDEQDRMRGARFGNGVIASWTYDPVIGVLRSIGYTKGNSLLSLSYPL